MTMRVRQWLLGFQNSYLQPKPARPSISTSAGGISPNAGMAVAPPEAPRGLATVVGATSLGFVMVRVDGSIVNVALAQMGTDLGVEIAGLKWVVDAYTPAFASLLLPAGALGDRIGVRRVFVAGFFVFTVASLGCALSMRAAALIVARAAQGIGAARPGISY